MKALLARYRVLPGRGDHVASVLRLMAAAVERDEPGCVAYHVSRSDENPDMLVLYEEYVDEPALLAHRATPHFRELIEGKVVPELAAREREILTPLLDAPRGESEGEPGR